MHAILGSSLVNKWDEIDNIKTSLRISLPNKSAGILIFCTKKRLYPTLMEYSFVNY